MRQQQYNGWWIVIAEVESFNQNYRHRTRTSFYIKPAYSRDPSDSAYDCHSCISESVDGYPTDAIEKAKERIDKCHGMWFHVPATVEEYANLALKMEDGHESARE